MKIKARCAVIAAIAVAATLGVLAPAALANGPCGVDYNGPTACGVTAPATINGTIVQGNEQDYYVFWASAGTQVATTITNDISPSCVISGYGGNCGDVSMSLVDSSGEYVPGGSHSSDSYYYGGVLLTGKLVVTLDQTGTYYLIVNGDPASDGHNSLATPYAVSVTANSGSIQWPAPPPPRPSCVIPHFYGQTVATVQHRLAVNHCRAGRVVWASRRLVSHSKFGWPPRRKVFAVGVGNVNVHQNWWNRSSVGRVLPYNTVVNVRVASR